MHIKKQNCPSISTILVLQMVKFFILFTLITAVLEDFEEIVVTCLLQFCLNRVFPPFLKTSETINKQSLLQSIVFCFSGQKRNGLVFCRFGILVGLFMDYNVPPC